MKKAISPVSSGVILASAGSKGIKNKYIDSSKQTTDLPQILFDANEKVIHNPIVGY